MKSIIWNPHFVPRKENYSVTTDAIDIFENENFDIVLETRLKCSQVVHDQVRGRHHGGSDRF
jgi:hypothetical protein